MPSWRNGAAGVNIAGNAAEVDITTTGAVDINSAACTIDASAGISLDAADASNFTTSAGALTLNGAAGVNIVGTTTTGQLAVTGVSTFTGNIDANGNLDLSSVTFPTEPS